MVVAYPTIGPRDELRLVLSVELFQVDAIPLVPSQMAVWFFTLNASTKVLKTYMVYTSKDTRTWIAVMDEHGRPYTEGLE